MILSQGDRVELSEEGREARSNWPDREGEVIDVPENKKDEFVTVEWDNIVPSHKYHRDHLKKIGDES